MGRKNLKEGHIGRKHTVGNRGDEADHVTVGSDSEHLVRAAAENSEMCLRRRRVRPPFEEAGEMLRLHSC
jgi:hypothetical protein